MNFTEISTLINEHGLAVTLLLLICLGGYKTIYPYVKKRLEDSSQNQDALEDNVHQGYFKLVEETREVNKQIVGELQNINITNKELSETNKELSKTNRKLVESYDRRICKVEDTTEDIGKTVDKINTKIDIILK
ncbi:hypothetical protein DVV91_09835 [Clostridium botulinum]|uniref:hypothetical protein n=1 Tax=Clostridium botulinum TaxID=1491 RepID=UPI0019685AA1|nr:hypothetical protein [Clostridium botulinum]MBN1074640.1 hypothetical protein [Clostridium botulinum]MBY6838627.1 hypothetical protein [Clostridium botulinum]